jgi:hypothetical protein
MPTVSNTDAVDTRPRQVRNADATSRRRLGTARNGATLSSRKSTPVCRETWRSGRPPAWLISLKFSRLPFLDPRNRPQAAPMCSVQGRKPRPPQGYCGHSSHFDGVFLRGALLRGHSDSLLQLGELSRARASALQCCTSSSLNQQADATGVSGEQRKIRRLVILPSSRPRGSLTCGGAAMNPPTEDCWGSAKGSG